MTKDEIKSIVSAGGLVSFPYKTTWEDWMGVVEITSIGCKDRPPEYVVFMPGEFHKGDLGHVVDLFYNKVLTRKNIGLAIKGVMRHQLGDIEDDESRNTLIQTYWDEYFSKDFPEFDELRPYYDLKTLEKVKTNG